MPIYLEEPFLLSQPKQYDDATRENRIVETIVGKPIVMTALRQRIARKIGEIKEK
jgi:hypothetical protein